MAKILFVAVGFCRFEPKLETPAIYCSPFRSNPRNRIHILGRVQKGLVAWELGHQNRTSEIISLFLLLLKTQQRMWVAL